MEESDLNFYGSVQLVGEGIKATWLVILDSRAAIRFKRIFPSVDEAGRELKLKHNDENAEDLEWFIDRYQVKISSSDLLELKERAKASRELKRRHKAVIQGKHNPQPANLVLDLREYQKQGVGFLMTTRSGIIGDVLGLGKTAQAIGVISHRVCRPAVIVCQAHIQLQWQRELKKFTPSIKSTIVKQKKEYYLRGEVFIITYSKLAAWSDRFVEMGIKTVVYDECQELRHNESGKHAAAEWLSMNCNYVIGLSATPIYNYGGEIFNVCECIKKGALGSRKEFFQEWCNYDGQSAVVTDPVALGSHLRDIGLFIRRTRTEVSRELPPENRIVVGVGYDEEVMKRNEFKNEELARKILEGSFSERGQAAREFDLKLRQATGIAKAPYVAEYVKELVEAGEKVLLCAWHREVYEVWRRKFVHDWQIPFWMYTGSESTRQKDEAANGFMRSKSGVMAMSLRSGAGLDGLQESCTIVAFGELDWSGKVHDQCVGRSRRDGQKKSVTSIFFTSDAGSDPIIARILGIKEQQSTGIIDLGVGKELDRQSTSGRITQMAREFLLKRAS